MTARDRALTASGAPAGSVPEIFPEPDAPADLVKFRKFRIGPGSGGRLAPGFEVLTKRNVLIYIITILIEFT